MEVQTIATQSAFSTTLPLVQMETVAALLAAIIITTMIAPPLAEIQSSKRMSPVIAIAPPHASTPTSAPSIPSTVRPLPAMPSAAILRKQVVPMATAAVHWVAIALTILIATPFAKII